MHTPAPILGLVLLGAVACGDETFSRGRMDTGVNTDSGMYPPLALKAGMTFTYQGELHFRAQAQNEERDSIYTLRLTIDSVMDGGSSADSTLKFSAEGMQMFNNRWDPTTDVDLWVARLGPALNTDVIPSTVVTEALSTPPKIPDPTTPKKLPVAGTFFLDVRKMDQIRSSFFENHQGEQPQTVDPTMTPDETWQFGYSRDERYNFYYTDTSSPNHNPELPPGRLFGATGRNRWGHEQATARALHPDAESDGTMKPCRWLAPLAVLILSGCGGCDDPKTEPTCELDDDCREGERCTMEGKCVVGAECVRDQDCVDSDPRKQCNLETFVCDFRDGFADECDSSRPCPFGAFCSTLLGKCLDAATSKDCIRRSQCPANQICDRQANKCIPDPGCYGDQFCEEGEICDLVNHTCRTLAVECTSCAATGTCDGGGLCSVDTKECLAGADEPACQSGEQCDFLGRCVQCTNSTECGPGTFCNVSLGRCESNVQCVDDQSQCPDTPEVTCVTCTEPEVCDPRTKRCQAPPMICSDDTECDENTVCDKSVDPPVCVPRIPVCINDLLDEPRNDVIATAVTLEPGDTLFDELKVCPGDVDWYRLDATAGSYLTVDARFEHDDGDIELQLFLPDGRTVLDQSRSVTDNERVELEVGTDLTLFVKVFLATPTSRPVDYRLIVARDPGDLCMDDDNEPDDGQGQAKQLIDNVPFEGRLCPADPDWFVIRNVPEATRITARLSFVDNLGDLDLEFYRAGESAPQLVADSLDDNESLTYDASYGGDFFVRVLGKAADTNVYTLRVELEEGQADACLDDPLEPNNTLGTPTSSSAVVNAISDLTICAGDEDWFAIHLAPGEALTAEIGFDPEDDLELRLYDADTTDPDTQPEELSNGTQPREFVARRDPAGGDYLLRVHGHNDAAVTPYQLDLQVFGAFVCSDDIYDQQSRGDTQADAVRLPFPPTRQSEVSICSGDDDWYQLWIIGDAANYIRLQYLGADATLDFEVWQGAGRVFTSVGQPFPNHREVAITIPGAPSTLALADVHVFRTSGGEAAYSLSSDLVPVFSCANDPYEPNNFSPMASMATSSSISPVLISDGTLCASVRDPSGGDEDWYILNPPAEGARINASLTFTQGDLLMELFSPGAVARACLNFGPDRCFSDGLNLEETISFTATTTESYLLRVSSVYSSPNAQIRPPDIDTAYELLIEYIQ